MLHMLDTDSISYLIKGRSAALEAKVSSVAPSEICISVMTQAELLYGLKRLPTENHLHLAVRQCLKIIRVLSWDASAAEWYADIRNQLTTSGQPIGEMDMMIAAHALSVGAELITNNTRHYSRITAPLLLANWLT